MTSYIRRKLKAIGEKNPARVAPVLLQVKVRENLLLQVALRRDPIRINFDSCKLIVLFISIFPLEVIQWQEEEM